jgi:hypothetical protein
MAQFLRPFSAFSSPLEITLPGRVRRGLGRFCARRAGVMVRKARQHFAARQSRRFAMGFALGQGVARRFPAGKEGEGRPALPARPGRPGAFQSGFDCAVNLPETAILPFPGLAG